METLTANLSGSIRRDILNGREHIVAPLSLIVPGVLNGSQGPLLYPLEEVQRDPTVWNGVPITLHHPTRDGLPVSARDPDVLNTQGIGIVLRSRVNGKLQAEGWFDVANTRKIAPEVLAALESGKPIELSTGLFTENEPAPEGATHNGKQYVAIARNYKPDHLAVLPGQVGACSINDGCGVLVNQEQRETIWQKLAALVGITTNQPLPDEQTNNNSNSKTPAKGESDMADKKPTVDYLIANCECWAEADRETLNAFEADKLAKMKADFEKTRELHAAYNALQEEKKKLEAEKDKPKEQPTANQTNPNPPPAKPATKEEWFAAAPPEVQSAVRNAMRIENEEKQKLIKRLVANLDESERKAESDVLANKSLDELERMVKYLPKEQPQQQPAFPNYLGAGGGQVDNYDADAEREYVEAMTPKPMDYVAIANEKNTAGRA